jgi:hypothetical protein
MQELREKQEFFFLWGSWSSCAPVVNRRSKRVYKPLQAWQDFLAAGYIF